MSDLLKWLDDLSADHILRERPLTVLIPGSGAYEELKALDLNAMQDAAYRLDVILKWIERLSTIATIDLEGVGMACVAWRVFAHAIKVLTAWAANFVCGGDAFWGVAPWEVQRQPKVSLLAPGNPAYAAAFKGAVAFHEVTRVLDALEVPIRCPFRQFLEVFTRTYPLVPTTDVEEGSYAAEREGPSYCALMGVVNILRLATSEGNIGQQKLTPLGLLIAVDHFYSAKRRRGRDLVDNSFFRTQVRKKLKDDQGNACLVDMPTCSVFTRVDAMHAHHNVWTVECLAAVLGSTATVAGARVQVPHPALEAAGCIMADIPALREMQCSLGIMVPASLNITSLRRSVDEPKQMCELIESLDVFNNMHTSRQFGDLLRNKCLPFMQTLERVKSGK